MAGSWVGRSVGVLLPWAVIAVAASLPMSPNLHLWRGRSLMLTLQPVTYFDYC